MGPIRGRLARLALRECSHSPTIRHMNAGGLGALVPQLVLDFAFTPVARSVNSYAVVVAVVAIARVIALPFVAIGSTLYYLQLREAAAAAGSGPPPRRF